jgi:hypothetical protein
MSEHPDTTQRDEEVGRLLDAVELDHGPAYWDGVRSATGPQLAKLRPRPLWARRPYQVGVAVAAAAAVVAGRPDRSAGPQQRQPDAGQRGATDALGDGLRSAQHDDRAG